VARSNSFLLVIVLLSVCSFSTAFADPQLNFSSNYIDPGETIHFNGTFCGRFTTAYYGVFIKEPSHRYNFYPDYINITINRTDSCGGYNSNFIVNGSITIPNDFVSGEYELVIDFTRRLNDYVYTFPFKVGNSSKEWKSTQSYPGNDWYEEGYNDTDWNSGFMPFGNPNLFPGNTNGTWYDNQIYVRKEIYLDEYTQANLKMFAENSVECYVNGNYVGNHESLHALESGNCYNNVYVYDNRDVTATDDDYRYYGIKYVDVSKYLKPGKNVIACNAQIWNDIFVRRVSNRRYYYPGRQFLDVEFTPLQKNETRWTTGLSNKERNTSHLHSCK